MFAVKHVWHTSPAWAPDTVAARAMRRRPAALALASTLAATWIAYALVTSVRFSSGLARPDPECSSAQEVSICSHQLKGMSSLPLNTDGTDEATPPRDGSLAGMTAMWREGITCFDVDGVLTSDGVMLATHPKRFADATGGARPAEMTLARARDAGADEAGFPTLDDVIAHFASLVEATAPDARPHWWRGDDSFAKITSVSPRRRGRRPAAPPLTGPVLCLDLKGDALAPAHAVRLVRLADDLNVRGRVLVYVYDGGKDDAVLNAIKATKRPSVAVGLGRRDENPAHRSVSALSRVSTGGTNEHDEASGGGIVRAIVPSVGFDARWYEAAVQTGLHVVSWVVDDEATLGAQLALGVSGVITNEPGRMLRALHDTRIRCERKEYW